MLIERLARHLQERPAQIMEARAKGTRVVGYFPGNYVPEELIMAAGAIPLGLIAGGDTRPVEASGAIITHVFCPFARAQLGERILKRDPYYSMIDLLVAPITCQHLKKVAEIWEYNGEMEIFKLGIPHQNTDDFEIEYYHDRLEVLKARLQAFTGNEVTDSKIRSAVELYNRIRELLRKISLLRRNAAPLITTADFIELNHASFYADPVFMVDVLSSLYQELKQKQEGSPGGAPRLLLIGPNIGYGDSRIMDMVEEAGGEIVVEEVCEGIRSYWHTISVDNDPIVSLATGYLRDRVPCAFMRNSSTSRLDHTLKLIADFKVSGVVWYQLLGCETYDAESYFFTLRLSERNIPVLILESDYGMAGRGQNKTRLQAFIEMIKGVD